MTVLQTIAVAFAMFSALPVPQFDWNEKNMRYALCAFPLIGAVIGGAWCLCGVLPLPAMAKAAGFCLLPVWVTGGIHLDGYADTCDALSSYGDRERPPLRGLCSYPAVQLFRGLFCALCLPDLYPPGGAALDAGSGAGTEPFGTGGGVFSHGEKHRPCPYFCHSGGPEEGSEYTHRSSSGAVPWAGAAGWLCAGGGGAAGLFAVS